MEKSDEQLLIDIMRARAFLLQKLPRSDPEDPLKTWFQLSFPDLDKAVAVPFYLGQPLNVARMEYRLSWTKTGMRWVAKGFDLRRSLGMPKVGADFDVPET